MRKRVQQTLGTLAAQTSASARRSALADPLNSVKETPEALAALGVTKARQQRQLGSDRRDWMANMCMAASALRAALDALQSDLEYVEQWEIADLHLTVAQVNWRQDSHLNGALSAARAVLTHPVMVGRPLKPLLRRFGLA